MISDFFDGFSVFRDEDIEYYTVYKKKDLFMKKNNLKDYLDVLPDIEKVETFDSCINLFLHFRIFAFSLEKRMDIYSVGIFKKIINNDLLYSGN